MPIAPAHLAAIAFGLLGVGLIVAAFVGSGGAATRLVLGIVLLVIAMITSGLQLLNAHAAPANDKEGN